MSHTTGLIRAYICVQCISVAIVVRFEDVTASLQRQVIYNEISHHHHHLEPACALVGGVAS